MKKEPKKIEDSGAKAGHPQFWPPVINGRQVSKDQFNFCTKGLNCAELRLTQPWRPSSKDSTEYTWSIEPGWTFRPNKERWRWLAGTMSVCSDWLSSVEDRRAWLWRWHTRSWSWRWWPPRAPRKCCRSRNYERSIMPASSIPTMGGRFRRGMLASDQPRE